MKNVTPYWNRYNVEKFPAVQWKLQKLKKLKTNNWEKYKKQYAALQEKLLGKAKKPQ